MHRLRVPTYVSPFEQFMGEFLRQHPDVIEDQERGWYIWWDHRLDLDEAERQAEDEVPAKPYPYQ